MQGDSGLLAPRFSKLTLSCRRKTFPENIQQYEHQAMLILLRGGALAMIFQKC